MSETAAIDISNPTTYYKATRRTGTDFYTGTVDYAAALLSGEVIRHPRSDAIVPNCAATYLSISTEPAETLIGGAWPARLFRVESVGEVVGDLRPSKHKRGVLALKVVEELPAWRVFGPNGQDVVEFIETVESFSRGEVYRLGDVAYLLSREDRAARGIRYGAQDVIEKLARPSCRLAAYNFMMNGLAACLPNSITLDIVVMVGNAIMFRDHISAEQYAALTAAWRAAGMHGLSDDALEVVA